MIIGTMDENRAGTWDIIIKILLLVGAVGSGLWAVLVYRMTTEKEFRRPVWDQQVALYFKATEAAGKIAALPSEERGKSASAQEFWDLYFGPLVVVEDDELVCRAMVDFGHCIPTPGAAFSTDKCDDQEIQHRALILATRFRDSISQEWDKKLDQLKEPADKRKCRMGTDSGSP